jgi:tetratricopeptide (TPR) repeat protein
MSIDVLEQAQQQLQFGFYELALISFEAAIAIDPESPTAWEGKATALKKLNRWNEAIAADEKAIALRANALQFDADFYYEQGNAKFGNGDFVGAIASYDQAVSIKPDYRAALTNRVIALFMLNRYEKAIGAANSTNPLAADQLLTLDAFKAAIATYHQRQLVLPPAIAAIADALESHIDHLDRLSESDDTFDLLYQTARSALQTQSSQRAKFLDPTAAADPNQSLSAHGEIPAIVEAPPASPPIKRFVLSRGYTDVEQQAFAQYIQILKQLNPQWIVVPDTCDTSEAEAYIMLYNDERYQINHVDYIASQLISRFLSLSQ